MLARLMLGGRRSRYWGRFSVVTGAGVLMGIFGLRAQQWYHYPYKDDGLGAFVITAGSAICLVGFAILIIVALWAAANERRIRAHPNKDQI